MHWIFLALLAPAFYAVANLLDNFLSGKLFKNPVSLVFYSSLFNLAFIPFAFAFGGLPDARILGVVFLLGLINIGYLYPYYRGLQSDDTSVATSFFSLSRILIPIWAYLIVGERLSFANYAGMGIILASSVFLSLSRRQGSLRFSRALWYIGLAALMLSFEGVLFKYAYEHGSTVGAALGGQMSVSLLLGTCLLFIPKARKIIRDDFPIFRSSAKIFVVEESFTFLAVLSESGAIDKAPVSLVKSITLVTPFYLLLYARLFGKRFPNWFKENSNTGSLLKKSLAFSGIIIGTLLIS